MSKGIIILAFATCCKTYLGNKYSNIIDLESSKYRYINVPDKTLEECLLKDNINLELKVEID